MLGWFASMVLFEMYFRRNFGCKSSHECEYCFWDNLLLRYVEMSILSFVHLCMETPSYKDKEIDFNAYG